MSPSSRRAWIEILKGSERPSKSLWSPSSRRAWIEMAVGTVATGKNVKVALLAEGVDRNMPTLQKLMEQISRPPRGGRG